MRPYQPSHLIDLVALAYPLASSILATPEDANLQHEGNNIHTCYINLNTPMTCDAAWGSLVQRNACHTQN